MESEQLSSSARARILNRVLLTIWVIVWFWTCGGYRYLIGVPGLVVVPLMIAVPITALRSLRRRKLIVGISLLLFVIVFVALLIEKPKRYRNWIESCKKPPVVRFPNEEVVNIKNFTAIKLRSVFVYYSGWVKRRYYLDQ
ncbi:MAG: hypothetical protein VX577_10195, partial [Verrucomicrobiota bacterium]|nr:hypothetical protein [Verrucomicrobiota bacterium]